MPRIVRLGMSHCIKINDEAYFFVQKKIIEMREKGSVLTPVEIVSNLILNNQRI